MTNPLILDGKTLAKSAEAELVTRVEALKKANGSRTPILATILVGDDPASATYVAFRSGSVAVAEFAAERSSLAEC